MKLKSSLSERPSFVLLAPMLNFLIILGLVMTRSAALDRVKVSTDEAPFILSAEEDPFLVVVSEQSNAVFYLDREPFDRFDQLIIRIKELKEEAAKRGVVRNSVVIESANDLGIEFRNEISSELVDDGFQVAVVKNEGVMK